MSWRVRGISMFRKAFNGSLKKNVKDPTIPNTTTKIERTLSSCCEPPPPKCLFDYATVPEGCWQTGYDEMMEFDNKVFRAGLVILFASFFLSKEFGGVPGAPEIVLLDVIFSQAEKNSDF